MEFLENITFRLRKRATSLSNDTLNESTLNSANSPLDGTSSSLPPNISDDESDEEIIQLRNELQKVNLQLSAAHDEINNLSLENMKLKDEIKNLDIKQKIMKQVTSKLTSEITVTPKKKAKRILAKSSANVLTTPREIDTPSQSPAVKEKLCVQNRHTETLQSQEAELSIKPKNTNHKLCIVSTNKDNKILSIAESTFQNYEFCHYVYPNCGTEQLTNNLEKKLIGYTINDFCIILIGEKDFNKTENYVDIIVKLRENLQKIQHTNIIICVPTFKLL